MVQKTPSKGLRLGYFYLFLFVFFIIGGIITKRVFGHPEFMMAWHLPGAVFLVLGGYKLTEKTREQYRKDVAKKSQKISNLN